MNNKKPKLLYILTSLIALACLLDIGTFLYFVKYNGSAFEINPLFILLQNWVSPLISFLIVLIYKIAVNCGIIWLLWKYKPQKSHVFAYFIVISAVSMIVLQLLGAYSNTLTHTIIENSEPGTVVPLTDEQAMKVSNIISYLYGSFVLMNLLIFSIYERIYRIPLSSN